MPFDVQDRCHIKTYQNSNVNSAAVEKPNLDLLYKGKLKKFREGNNFGSDTN